VTAGSLVASGTVLLIGHAFGQVASAVSVPDTARRLEACSGSAACTGRVLQSALDGQSRRLNNVPAEQWTPEEKSSFDACVDEIHRKGNDGLSAREKAHWQALLITRNAMVADDVVHDAILAVCLSSHRIRDVVPYFTRSAQNAAKREWRRGRRSCPLVIEDPNWSPNLCIQENVEVWNETIWMEASANDALCGLSADERKIIEWYVWDGLSHAQIAAKLRITEPAARQKFSRARRVLQEKFTERCQ
jgi:RNA polymerase sigma factor (sigma-70 family)